MLSTDTTVSSKILVGKAKIQTLPYPFKMDFPPTCSPGRVVTFGKMNCAY